MRNVPTTVKRRWRGITPIGVSVPCGMSSVTVSPSIAPI
jgi:hypothetical protein